VVDRRRGRQVSGAGAENVAAGEVKVRLGGEGSSADLRRRSSLKGIEPLLEVRSAIVRRGYETQDGCKGTAMDDTLAGMAARLETQRVDVSSPDAGHVEGPSRPFAVSTRLIAPAPPAPSANHASARDPLATSFRKATPDATPSANQNTALQMVVATRNWLCNSAGANDDSTAG
jgi:hypothetical protein